MITGEKNQNILDNLLDGVVVFKYDGEIEYLNQSFSRILGVSEKRIQKKKDVKQIAKFLGMEESFFWIESPIYFDERISIGERCIDVLMLSKSIDKDTRIVIIKEVAVEQRLHLKYQAELKEKNKLIEDLKQAQNLLEMYNVKLEEEVKRKTKDLQSNIKFMDLVFNSLDQSIFTIDAQGFISRKLNKVADVHLEHNRNENNFSHFSYMPNYNPESISKWTKLVFSNKIPIQSILELGPSLLETDSGRTIKLNYHPLHEENELTSIVCIGSDITQDILNQRAEDILHEKSQLAINLLKCPLDIHDAIEKSNKLLEKLKTLKEDKVEDGITFDIHTIKGLCQLLCIGPLSVSLELIEDSFKELDINRKTIVSELSHGIQRSIDLIVELAGESFFNKDNKSSPIKSFLSTFNSFVQKISRVCGNKIKPINISVSSDLEEYKAESVNILFQSYLQILKNSVTHGIESPEYRAMLGKNEYGTISIDVNENDNYLKIVHIDDGKGLCNSDGVVPLSSCLGGLVQVKVTSSKKTIYSGRNVGMNAFVSTIESFFNGTVYVDSKINEYTKIIITIPISEIKHEFFADEV